MRWRRHNLSDMRLRPLVPRGVTAAHLLPLGFPSIRLDSPQLSWQQFWSRVSLELRRRAYSRGTRLQYRSVLRKLARYASCGPAELAATDIVGFLRHLAAQGRSSSTIGMAMSVIRTAFDKMAGCAFAVDLHTPRRAARLPEILSVAEVRRLLAALDSPRDQLLVGLIYGCGLKVSEATALRWQDIDLDGNRIRITRPRAAQRRTVELPADLRPVLATGVAHCDRDSYVFTGRLPDRPLCTRVVEEIIRGARLRAGILKPVTAMTLRHTYAVHCLEAGVSIRALQEALGHASVKTTRRYQRCVVPTAANGLIAAVRSAECDAALQRSCSRPDARRSLYAEEPRVDPALLPFRDMGEPTDRPSVYQILLKARLRGRFLASRRCNGPPG